MTVDTDFCQIRTFKRAEKKVGKKSGEEINGTGTDCARRNGWHDLN